MIKSAEQEFTESILNLFGPKKNPENFLFLAVSCLEFSAYMFDLSLQEKDFYKMISDNYQLKSEDIIFKNEDLNSLPVIDLNQRTFMSKNLFKIIVPERKIDFEVKATILLGIAISSFKSLGISREHVLSVAQQFFRFSIDKPEETFSRTETER